VIVHVPIVSKVSVELLTVQTLVVVEEKLTGRPELADAKSMEGPGSEKLPGFANVIVCEPGVIAKVRVTGVATPKVEFPGWVAVIEHVPMATSVTVVTATVQTAGVFDAKPTTRPEVAVAVTENGIVPKVTGLSAANVIVCTVELVGLTVKLCIVGVAAAKVAFPGCVAVIEHVPTATRVTVLPLVPDVVHTGRVVEAKVTVRVELAVAVTAKGAAPKFRLLIWPKVIACGSRFTVKP
jgi:hypothetical protein